MRRSLGAFLIVALALLVWSAPAGAQAPGPTTIVVADALHGTEASTGTIDGDTRRGVVFRGTAVGTHPGGFAVTVDYTPAAPVCPGRNRFTQGSFDLTTAAGTLSGRVVSGQVSFTPYCAFGYVSAVLEVTGGTGVFAGMAGRGSFAGVLDHTPLALGQPARLVGGVRFVLRRSGTTTATAPVAGGR